MEIVITMSNLADDEARPFICANDTAACLESANQLAREKDLVRMTQLNWGVNIGCLLPNPNTELECWENYKEFMCINYGE